MTTLTSVVVAVTTYQRNDFLPALLTRLTQLRSSVDIPVRILIVDNNPEQDALPVVEGLALDVHYEHEPQPGIAAGRNKALDWASAAGFDAVAFLDDDETPTSDWLRALIDTANTYSCPAVTGPVVREYPAPPDEYVAGMRRWDYVRRPTGAPVPAASSANLLLDVAFLREHGLRFDQEFGLSGGSDTLITRQIIQAGGLVRWSDEAIVIDHVTPDRLTPQWLRKRAKRVGNTHSRVSLALADARGERRRTRLRLAAKGSALVVVGAVQAGAAAITGNEERRGAGSWRRARGAGIVSGAFGHVAYDYSRSLPAGVGETPADGG